MCEGRYWVDIGHLKKERVAICLIGNIQGLQINCVALYVCATLFSLWNGGQDL